MDRCLGKWRWRAGFKLAKKLAKVVGGPCSQANNQNRSLQGLVWEASFGRPHRLLKRRSTAGMITWGTAWTRNLGEAIGNWRGG